MDTINKVTPNKLSDCISRGDAAVIVDVRTPVEFREAHIRTAANIPLDRISADAVYPHANGTPLYLMCRTGKRAEEAYRKLTKQGAQNLAVVEGGMEACAALDLDLVHGKKAVSIERQVRIAAGSMVAVGTLLGAFIHPAFLVVPAFVGAGLAFAGITDTCAMGMLLSRMPWNQVGHGSEAACSR